MNDDSNLADGRKRTDTPLISLENGTQPSLNDSEKGRRFE